MTEFHHDSQQLGLRPPMCSILTNMSHFCNRRADEFQGSWTSRTFRGWLHQVQDLSNHVLMKRWRQVIEFDLAIRDVPDPEVALNVHDPSLKVRRPEDWMLAIAGQLEPHHQVAEYRTAPSSFTGSGWPMLRVSTWLYTSKHKNLLYLNYFWRFSCPISIWISACLRLFFSLSTTKITKNFFFYPKFPEKRLFASNLFSGTLFLKYSFKSKINSKVCIFFSQIDLQTYRRHFLSIIFIEYCIRLCTADIVMSS